MSFVWDGTDYGIREGREGTYEVGVSCEIPVVDGRCEAESTCSETDGSRPPGEVGFCECGYNIGYCCMTSRLGAGFVIDSCRCFRLLNFKAHNLCKKPMAAEEPLRSG